MFRRVDAPDIVQVAKDLVIENVKINEDACRKAGSGTRGRHD
ncbi:MAG: hypothetical protein P8020_16210 [Acidobacteriota bacterium]|jgi:hypothetical protein